MKFSICITAVILMAISAAGAQMVASHSSTMQTAPAAGAALAPSVQVTGKPVARVNGAVLTDRDLLREMFAIFPYAKQHNGFPKDLEPQIRKGALDMIIFEELVYQEAKRRNMTVPQAQITRAEGDFRKQFQTQSEYQDYLKFEFHGSRAVLREKIRRSLLIEALFKQEVTDRAKVNALQARAFYDRNPKNFEHTEMFHIQSISILPPENSNPDVLKDARKKAEDAWKQAKATKNYQEFGLLAEKISDDDFRVNMGDHKPVEREKLPPPIVKAALAMQAGQVSELLQLGNAYTIFRLVAHTPAGRVPFAEVKTKVQSDLQKQKTEQIRAALGQKLRNSAKIETL